jgi:hypothetical protein
LSLEKDDFVYYLIRKKPFWSFFWLDNAGIGLDARPPSKSSIKDAS